MSYLRSLFSEVYIKDIVERKKIERQDVLEQILDLLCSSIGLLTNPAKIANTLQSAYAMPTDEKADIELRPFALTGDSFPKIVVRKDIGRRWYDDKGILNINLIDFLLDKELI